jgi:NAD dependent epimerase/dehydratase family enzyme
MSQILAEVLNKPTFMPAVPALLLKLVMGEFGSVLLEGQRVLPKRLLDMGFQFQFSNIREALEDLLKEKIGRAEKRKH